MDKNDISRKLNDWVRDDLKRDEALNWFQSLEAEEGKEVLQLLIYFFINARVQPSDIDPAVALAKLKPTFTPVVLLKAGPIKLQAAKAANLIKSEAPKTFILFLSLFRISDQRRRLTECINGCNHWWHKI